MGLYPWRCSRQCGMSRIPSLSGISIFMCCYTQAKYESLQGPRLVTGGRAGGAVSDRETLEYKDDRRCEYTGRSPNSGVLIALAGTDWRQDRCEAKGNRVIVFCFQEARGASWILFSNSASPCRGKADITSVSCTFVLYCFCLYSQKCLFLCPVIDVCVFFNPLCLLR